MPRFVVHEHHASHLHWDFRLEMDGVLKSWAVPKLPPTEPGVRRLAVQVEDHPLNYINFEGEIEEGYGKGTVAIWDRGTYELEGRSDKLIKLALSGEKLKGRYSLVFTGYGGKGTGWLLMKSKDEKAPSAREAAGETARPSGAPSSPRRAGRKGRA